MNAIRLVRIDFDSMENRISNAISYTEIGIFVDSDITAYAKIKEWFSKQNLIKCYIGWDHEVYPQWRLKETDII